jgi:hypothetical protein
MRLAIGGGSRYSGGSSGDHLAGPRAVAPTAAQPLPWEGILTHATRAVLAFLKDKSGRSGQCWWGQQKIADTLVMDRGTVIRAIKALVRLGEIVSERRGPTSNVYKMMLQNATGEVAKCNISSIELNLKKEKKPAKREERIMPSVAAVSAQPNCGDGGECRSEGSTQMPPYQIRNEFGGLIINPEYQRIREVLSAADDRIRRARNPEAYARAIIEREWRTA